MNKWKEFKLENIVLYKVDPVDVSALFVLYENCHRMGNENNNNVMMATVHPEIWFDDISSTILSSVSYITKFTAFETKSLHDKDLILTNYVCDIKEFELIENLKKFLIEKGRLSILVVYSIIQCVDLKNLKTRWFIRYREIIDPQTIRDKKIDYLTNGTDNN